MPRGKRRGNVRNGVGVNSRVVGGEGGGEVGMVVQGEEDRVSRGGREGGGIFKLTWAVDLMKYFVCVMGFNKVEFGKHDPPATRRNVPCHVTVRWSAYLRGYRHEG